MFSAHGNSESEKFFEKLISQTIFFFSSKQVLPSNLFFPIKTSKQSYGHLLWAGWWAAGMSRLSWWWSGPWIAWWLCGRVWCFENSPLALCSHTSSPLTGRRHRSENQQTEHILSFKLTSKKLDLNYKTSQIDVKNKLFLCHTLHRFC